LEWGYLTKVDRDLLKGLVVIELSKEEMQKHMTVRHCKEREGRPSLQMARRKGAWGMGGGRDFWGVCTNEKGEKKKRTPSEKEKT